MEARHLRNFSSKEFGSKIESCLRQLQKEKSFCDVTITCEGRNIEAHKVVLARGSRVFNKIFKLNPQTHTVIILRDVKFSYLLNILDYMYQGEVSIDKRELTNFLAVARDLEVNDLKEEAFKDLEVSSASEDKNKKQRLGSSPKQQFNLDCKIKIDKKPDDSCTLDSDLKSDKFEDFEQFADEDFDDESEGIAIKKNRKYSSPKTNPDVAYKIKSEVAHNLEVNDFIEDSLKDSKGSEDKNKKQCSSSKQQLSIDYKIKTDSKLNDFHTVANDLKNYELKDFDSSPNQDQNMEYTIKIEMENIPTQDTGKGQSNNRVQRLMIRDIAKLAGNEKEDQSIKTCLKCEHCKKSYSDKGSLNKHVMSIHKGIKYQCSQCDYKAGLKQYLKKHVLSIHKGIRYPCSQCDYKATRKETLKTHILSIHEGIRRYPCAQCDYKSATKNNLKTHVLSVHEGIRRYPYSKCDYKATQKSHLKSHTNKLH